MLGVGLGILIAATVLYISAFPCYFSHPIVLQELTLLYDMFSYSDRAVNSQDMRAHNFLEVGAAALLVGDIESKMNGQPWKFFGTDDMPYLDQLLQSSPVTPITDSASARPQLRVITASKRTKQGSHQIWYVLLSDT